MSVASFQSLSNVELQLPNPKEEQEERNMGVNRILIHGNYINSSNDNNTTTRGVKSNSGELRKLLLASNLSPPSNNNNINLNPRKRILFHDRIQLNVNNIQSYAEDHMSVSSCMSKVINMNRYMKSNNNSENSHVLFFADNLNLDFVNDDSDRAQMKLFGEFYSEVMKALLTFQHQGHSTNIRIEYASDRTLSKSDYWANMLHIARRYNISKIKKCFKSEGHKDMKAVQLLDVLMQCTDMTYNNSDHADVVLCSSDSCRPDVDYYNLNMLTGEFCSQKVEQNPTITSATYHNNAHNNMQSFWSSSKNKIFMYDSEETTQEKITSADIDTCLDFLKQIIFVHQQTNTTNPINNKKSTLQLGEHKFYGYDDLHQAFISQKISETEIRNLLIIEMNKILSPVRQHFAQNEHIKKILTDFQELINIKSEEKKFRNEKKLNLVESGRVPKGSHLVFLQPPLTQPTLQSVLNIITQIRSSPSYSSSSTTNNVVLFISDWSSYIQNHTEGGLKDIHQYYDLFLSALNKLFQSQESNKQIEWTILKQSDLISSSEYWSNVIHIARHFTLDQIMGNTITDSDRLGKVLANLMHIADVVSVSPGSIAYSSTYIHASTSKSLVSNYVSALFSKNNNEEGNNENIRPPIFTQLDPHEAAPQCPVIHLPQSGKRDAPTPAKTTTATTTYNIYENSLSRGSISRTSSATNSILKSKTSKNRNSKQKDRRKKSKDSSSRSSKRTSISKAPPQIIFRPSCDAYTPRINDKSKPLSYKPASERSSQAIPATMGTITRPNFRDALRRVSMILHQHILKIERRFEARNNRDPTGLFSIEMRELFKEDNFARSRYKCTMIRLPMVSGGFACSHQKLRADYEVATQTVFRSSPPSPSTRQVRRNQKRAVHIPSEFEIYEFAHQLFKKVQLSSECSIVCLIYIERLMEVAKVPFMASTWRPIFMAGLLMASKVWQDLSSWNIEFASVYPQFSLDAINRLELLFLRNVKWDLYISSSLYAKYYFSLRSLLEKDSFRQRYYRFVGAVGCPSASDALKVSKRSEKVKEEALMQLSRSM